MMRRLLVWLAFAAILMAVLAEIGGPFLLPAGGEGAGAAIQKTIEALPEEERAEAARQLAAQSGREAPPGLASRALAGVDFLLLWTAFLFASATAISPEVHARVRAIATPLVCLMAAILLVVLIFLALGRLIMLLTLLLSAPFGTIVYLAVYGGFGTGAVLASLGAASLFRALFIGFLLASSWRYINNWTLLLITGTGFLCTVIAGVVFGLLPGILHAIGDAALALLFAIFALVWALILLVRSIPGLTATLRR